jgi:hypothetical protein
MAVSVYGIIGPYFFDQNLNGDVYMEEILEPFYDDLTRFVWRNRKA